MFTTLKYRRHTAVLATLAMVASVMVAAPAVADDPMPDYKAMFDACEGVDSADFQDVPAKHPSAGSIDCIAYYGITKGTGDGSTYSPSMSVTREHMALFLTRLAELVGIEIASDPADAGFIDIGDLSVESQTAINQLADLDITQGTNTAGTTYSPADSVKRGHMALFIARLMDLMAPFDDGDVDTDPVWAWIPKLVVDVPDGDDPDDVADKTVKSPFTDIDRTTKEAYDAITALWELDVASGYSSTAYSPSSSITRAHMADFIAGMLDHSNARPAGVTAQVTETTDFGTVEATMVVSARDDEFAPLADASIKVFTASDSGGFDDESGKCLATGNPCEWTDTENYTNNSGNYLQPVSVTTNNGATPPGMGNMENGETWYSWMGSEEESEFVKGSSGEAMVTLTATPNALGIRVTSNLPENNTGEQVDIGTGAEVVITAQLIDTETATDDSNPVAKEGVTLSITRERGSGNADRPGPADMKTDADGKVTFTITGPEDDVNDNTQTRNDAVTFRGDVDNAMPADEEEGTITIQWRETDPVVTNSVAKTDASYAIIDDGKVSIRVTVNYYDQYGNPDAQNDTATLTINSPSDNGAKGQASRLVRVRNNGSASFRGTVNATAGTEVDVTVSPLTTATTDADDPDDVLAVRHAHKNDDGHSGNQTAADSQVIVDADNNRFIIDSGDADSSTARAGVLYSYDSGDTFIVGDKSVDMDTFEKEIATNGKTVTVVFYTTDGVSIFSVEATS